MLCEIHRRKTSQPPPLMSPTHHCPSGSYFPFPPPLPAARVSLSPTDSEDVQLASWPSSPPTPVAPPPSTAVAALSEDNQRLRRSNNMLMSEIAHMRKLYNDIIYFVQNHVKPVAPSSSFPLQNDAVSNKFTTNYGPTFPPQKPFPQLVGSSPKCNTVNGGGGGGGNIKSTKLFGVPIHSSKKRVHPDHLVEMNKARFVLEKDDLGLNLMPPSSC